jgi:hypothetical protein
MDAVIHGRVADIKIAEGSGGPFRQGSSGDQLVNMFGRYAELAKRGRLFCGITAVGGVAPGTAIGTTAAHALANPLGSNVDLVVLRQGVEYVSGTLGIGVVDWVAHLANLILPTGTAIPIVPGRIDGGAPQGRLLTTATVLTGGTVFRQFCNLPPMLATSVLAPWAIWDDIDGAIRVPPGTSVSLQGTAAAGTTPLVRFTTLWAEEDR